VLQIIVFWQSIDQETVPRGKMGGVQRGAGIRAIVGIADLLLVGKTDCSIITHRLKTSNPCNSVQ
jgi:hypothetical protein